MCQARVGAQQVRGRSLMQLLVQLQSKEENKREKKRRNLQKWNVARTPFPLLLRFKLLVVTAPLLSLLSLLSSLWTALRHFSYAFLAARFSLRLMPL